MQRLLEGPTTWGRMGWPVDRKVFIQSLDAVRQTRNEVMHFSPDPLEEAALDNLSNFLKWVRELAST